MSKPEDDGVGNYGLEGLMQLISAPPNSDISLLARGLDPTVLGLNLKQIEPLSATLTSICSPAPPRSEPVYPIPPSYVAATATGVPNRINKTHLANMSDDTLFYIFYALGGDRRQLWAATELTRRGWTFNQGEKKWQMRPSDAELSQLAQNHQTTTAQLAQAVKYFEPAVWEIRYLPQGAPLLKDLHVNALTMQELNDMNNKLQM